MLKLADKGLDEMKVDTDPFLVMEINMVSFTSSHKPEPKGKGKDKKVYKHVRIPKEKEAKVVENNGKFVLNLQGESTFGSSRLDCITYLQHRLGLAE